MPLKSGQLFCFFMALYFKDSSKFLEVMRILFVMNPSSGRKGNDEVIQHIHEVSPAGSFEYKIHLTTGNDDDQILQREIRSYCPDRVAACGGDGTVQLVARNLLNIDIPMGRGT